MFSFEQLTFQALIQVSELYPSHSYELKPDWSIVPTSHDFLYSTLSKIGKIKQKKSHLKLFNSVVS